jgi:hypothetical protein
MEGKVEPRTETGSMAAAECGSKAIRLKTKKAHSQLLMTAFIGSSPNPGLFKLSTIDNRNLLSPTARKPTGVSFKNLSFFADQTVKKGFLHVFIA